MPNDYGSNSLPFTPMGEVKSTMAIVLKKICLIAICGLMILANTRNATPQSVAEVGQTAPPFTLADEFQNLHSLEDYLGKPIILYFTHNMCHYCTQIIAFLKRAQTRYQGTDLAILTIYVWADEGELIKRYKEAYDLPFPMLAGKNPTLLRNYEVNYVPIIAFINREGVIQELYHHYILETDFTKSAWAIVDGK